MKKEFYLIVNEKINDKNNNFFCENIDIQTISNHLSSEYKLTILTRYSKTSKPFILNKSCHVISFRFNNLIKIIQLIIASFFKKKNFLIISITPFNFFCFFLFFLFKSKFFLFLRSSGQEEYKLILGSFYIWIYEIMFRIITQFSTVISCHSRLYNKKHFVLNPSELTNKWIVNRKKNIFNVNKINIFYVGRIKIEKGIYDLLELFPKLSNNIHLTIVGSGDPIKSSHPRIKILKFINSENKLIKIYDKNNIFILPSHTESYSKVIDESLSRFRPVILFDDIKYIIGNRLGVFSIKRNYRELQKKIDYIFNNNAKIHKNIIKNKLPTRSQFLKSLIKVLNKN